MRAGRFDVRDRVVLISGPARGIGRESARQLAARGARLSLVGIEPEHLESLVEELAPDRAVWFEADVRDAAALDRAVSATAERFGGIDVVVANAGVAAAGTIADIDPEDFERTIEVNLLGVWRTVRAALPFVLERRGYVLAVASMAAVVHLPLMGAYATARSGVSAFTDCLRAELQGTGTDVGCAYFGFVDTDMTRAALREPRAATMLRRVPEAPRLARPVPVERAGAAIVRGIEGRARWIVVPERFRPALFAPGLLQRLAERRMRRKGVADAVRSTR